MIEPQHPRLSVARQCELVSISRSGFYYQPAGETPLNLALMRLIDVQFLETPWYGSRQMARHLRREGYTVGRKRMRRLMARMGLEPIYQRPRTTIPHPGHRIYPYLLRDMVIDRPNQVWCADIPYIPMRRGFHYLARSWTGRRERFCPGDYRTPWTVSSALRLLKTPWHGLVALLSNSGPGVLANFGPPPVPQPTVTLMDQGAFCGLESQSGFVRAAPS